MSMEENDFIDLFISTMKLMNDEIEIVDLLDNEYIDRVTTIF